MAIKFRISDYSAWIQENLNQSAARAVASSPNVSQSETPDVSGIPPMLRRRLNLLGRASASQVMGMIESGSDTAIVYCSRHGDIERTLGVLQDLASDEPVSPMHFSLAVHNAVTGVISIHSRITSNISSIACAGDGLVPTLLEAVGLLSDDCSRVICILCDLPLPEFYRSHSDQPETPYAACFMVTAEEGQSLGLEYAGPMTGDFGDNGLPQGIGFAEFLDGDSRMLSARHNESRWLLHKL